MTRRHYAGVFVRAKATSFKKHKLETGENCKAIDEFLITW